MVFSSVPLYLDPSNWPQQPNQQDGVTSADHNPQLPPLLPPSMASGGGVGSRPGSMGERARLAKIPQPEAALKCPRCESTNTKFCYFNNYSLSQPRHFCKTCRRYWTKGGALRNVPVGGGCRRNKRSKGNNRSKSPAVLSDRGQTGSNPSSSTALASTSCTDVIEHMAPVVPPQLPLLPPLHDIGDFNSGDIVGLNFGGIQPQLAAVGGGPSGGSVLSTGLVEQWRLQQFPFLSNNLEPSTGLYPFEGAAVEPPPSYGQLRSKQLDGSIVSAVPQLASVKLEETQGGNFSRNFLGLSGTGNEHQFWGAGNAWTDLSGFTSSSTAHLL